MTLQASWASAHFDKAHIQKKVAHAARDGLE
jgi:hypothetical protein